LVKAEPAAMAALVATAVLEEMEATAAMYLLNIHQVLNLI
jgi:hypothetical protein